MARSGLTGRLAAPVKAPRIFRADETAGGAWIWMEHIEEVCPDPWTLDEFVFAARQLGRWNGAGPVDGLPLEAPWLTRGHYRSFVERLDNAAAWRFPLSLARIPASTRARQEQLWAERHSFYAVLEALPHAFMHLDTQRRNLLLRAGAGADRELVLLDWAHCGLGPLGAELSCLIGLSALVLAWPAEAVRELDNATFGPYVEGLRAGGWGGEVAQVRLAYAAWLALYLGCGLPAMLAWWCRPEKRAAALLAFGVAEDELFERHRPLLDYALDCADEARLLMCQADY